MKRPVDGIEIASDVLERDGIGIEVYRNNELMTEIFSDDANRTKVVTVFKDFVPFELMKEAMASFEREIPWEFIDYKEED